MPSAVSGGSSGGSSWYGSPTSGSSSWLAPAPTAPKLDQVQTGVFSLNLMSPQAAAGSLQQNAESANDFVAGLGEALFGEKSGLVTGIPLVGAPVAGLVRGVSDLPPVSLASKAPGALWDAVSTAASHIPTGFLGTDQAFADLPDTPEKREVEAQANADVLGGANLKFNYLKKVQEASLAAQKDTSLAQLFPDVAGIGGTPLAGSLGGIAVQALSLLTAPGRASERWIAGLNIRPDGANRLDEIMNLAQTQPDALTGVESVVVQKYGSGEWSADHALDFLSANFSGLAHDLPLQLVGSVLTDPTILAGFGAAGAARLARGAALAAEAGRSGSALGEVALALRNSEVGRVAGYVRTAIDPLSRLGTTPATRRVVDREAEAIASLVTRTGFGVVPVYRGFESLRAFDADVVDPVARAFAGWTANIRNQHLMDELMRSAETVGQKAYRALLDVTPETAVTELLRQPPVGSIGRLGEKVQRIRALAVEPEDLAQRMASAFGKTADDWLPYVEKASPNWRSYLHAATYGADMNSFLDLRSTLPRTAGGPPVELLTLGNPNTLTDTAAADVIKSLNAAKTIGEKRTAIIDALNTYDGLAHYVGYDPSDVTGSVNRALRVLDDLRAHQDLPKMLRSDEIARIPELVAWKSAHPYWDFLFEPPPERRWRPVFGSEGEILALNPWVAKVSTDAMATYVPGFHLSRNLLGMPGVDAPKVIQKPLDWIEVGRQAMLTRVSGALVVLSARNRFVEASIRRGFTQEEAKAIWSKLEKEAQWHGVSANALKATDMWKAIGELGEDRTKSLLPLRLAGEFTRRDLAALVLEAFEGDTFFVGLTQKFTGWMRKKLNESGPLKDFAGGNFAGQFSLDFYQKLRFQFHLLFQQQELVEPFILNPARGVLPIRGKLSDDLLATSRVWDVNARAGVFRMADFLDQREFTEAPLIGRKLAGDVVGTLPGAEVSLNQITGTARVKRANYYELWKSFLGKPTRELIGDEQWLQYKQFWGLADDNDVAVKYLTEMYSEMDDVGLRGDNALDYKALIENSERYLPIDVGAVVPLHLDSLANVFRVRNTHDLREALAKNKVTIDQLTEYLRSINASDTYIDRVVRALNFDYSDFWSQVRTKYNLADADYVQLRAMMEDAATIRGVTPVEYLSSIFAPDVRKVTTADLAATAPMRDQVTLLRALRGGGSTVEDLYRELARGFRHHLDPSTLRTLRERSGIRTRGAWGAAHDQWLADQMKDYANGVLPSDPDVARALQFMGRLTKDATKGLEVGSSEFKAIRDAYRLVDTSAGVPYNLTELLTHNAVTAVMKSLEEDAFRVHYFKRTRSVLERSVNHPFFGLYPASYMWGKILPEMVRFIALEPFGLKTGAMSFAFNNVYKTVEAQREWDSGFDDMLDKLGRNPAVFMLGYMLPAVPWDLPVVLPQWMRDLADQGALNAQRRARGMPTIDIDPGSPLERIASYIATPITDIQKLRSVGKETTDLVFGTAEEQKARGGPQVTIPGLNVRVGGADEQPSSTLEQLQATADSALQQLSQQFGFGNFAGGGGETSGGPQPQADLSGLFFKPLPQNVANRDIFYPSAKLDVSQVEDIRSRTQEQDEELQRIYQR